MTTQEAIRELQNIRQYCAAKSIPAVDFALKVLREKLEQEENSKKTGKSPGIRKNADAGAFHLREIRWPEKSWVMRRGGTGRGRAAS